MMGLLCFSKPSETRSFLLNLDEAGESHDLLVEFQKYSWPSFGFQNQDEWTSLALLRLLYRLSGGKFEVGEN